MTAFEHWLEKNGWTLTAGNRGDFSTYTNLMRRWDKGDKSISVGILVKPKSIGVIFPKMDFLPVNNFENYFEESGQFIKYTIKTINNKTCHEVHNATQRYIDFLNKSN